MYSSWCFESTYGELGNQQLPVASLRTRGSPGAGLWFWHVGSRELQPHRPEAPRPGTNMPNQRILVLFCIEAGKQHPNSLTRAQTARAQVPSAWFDMVTSPNVHTVHRTRRVQLRGCPSTERRKGTKTECIGLFTLRSVRAVYQDSIEENTLCCGDKENSRICSATYL